MKKLVLSVLVLMALLMIGCTPTVNGTTETNTWDFPIAEEDMYGVSTQNGNIIKCRTISESCTFAGFQVNTYSDNRVKLFAYYGGSDKRNGVEITSQDDIDTLNTILTYFTAPYSFSQDTDGRYDVVVDYLSKVNKIYKKYNGGNQPYIN